MCELLHLSYMRALGGDLDDEHQYANSQNVLISHLVVVIPNWFTTMATINGTIVVL